MCRPRSGLLRLLSWLPKTAARCPLYRSGCCSPLQTCGRGACVVGQWHWQGCPGKQASHRCAAKMGDQGPT